ncbi:MAG: PAS domain-containing protein, partial [Rhodothermales bacterium]
MDLHTLVLGPDASARAPLEQALQRRGHAVTLCVDLEEAVATYASRQHALVVAEVPSGQAGTTPLRRLREVLDAHRSLLAANWFERFIPPRQRADVEAIHHALLESDAETTEWNENLVLTASGEERCIAWHNATLRDEKGRITSTLSSGQDVTEQRRAEAALQRQADVLDQIHDAVISVDLAGHVTSWNWGAERLTGYTSEEVMGQPVFKLFPDAEPDVLRAQVARPLAEEGTHAAEVRLQKKSGEAAIVHVFFSLLRDKDGEAFGVIGSSMDVTQRKRAETALRDSEERSRRILQTTMDEFILADAEGIILEVNPAYAAMLGYATSEL